MGNHKRTEKPSTWSDKKWVGYLARNARLEARLTKQLVKSRRSEARSFITKAMVEGFGDGQEQILSQANFSAAEIDVVSRAKEVNGSAIVVEEDEVLLDALVKAQQDQKEEELIAGLKGHLNAEA